MGRKHSTVMGRAAGAALLTQKTITVSSSSSLSPGRPSAGRAKVDSRDDTLLTGTLHTPCSNGLSMSRPTMPHHNKPQIVSGQIRQRL